MRIKLALFSLAALLLPQFAHAATTTKQEPWGKTQDGKAIFLYTLKDGDFTVRITNFGARVVNILTPDRNGKIEDVALGFDNFTPYETDKNFFGALVGRYGNRIAKGQFKIDGKSFQTDTNNNGNMLHGGSDGFYHKVWTSHLIPSGVEMTYVSPDGEMGFPGTLTAHVKYTVTGHSLRMDYSATTDKPTVAALTNHTYFNLKGNARGTILDTVLTIPASRYTPVVTGLIPTGELAPTAGTPFDFREPTAIGKRIGDKNDQLALGKGYDHNFVLDFKGPGLHLAAIAYDPESGRTMEIKTTEPGIQFYSGNFLDSTVHGAYGVTYPLHGAFALEPQHFPDSPNQPKFPTTLLRPGQTLHSTSVYTFSVKK